MSNFKRVEYFVKLHKSRKKTSAEKVNNEESLLHRMKNAVKFFDAYILYEVLVKDSICLCSPKEIIVAQSRLLLCGSSLNVCIHLK